jgi:hypothetical protein
LLRGGVCCACGVPGFLFLFALSCVSRGVAGPGPRCRGCAGLGVAGWPRRAGVRKLVFASVFLTAAAWPCFLLARPGGWGCVLAGGGARAVGVSRCRVVLSCGGFLVGWAGFLGVCGSGLGRGGGCRCVVCVWLGCGCRCV